MVSPQGSHFLENGFHSINCHPGVEARPKRALVENAVDGKRGRVLNAAREVAFACDCNDEIGSPFNYNATGNGSPGGYCQVDMVFR